MLRQFTMLSCLRLARPLRLRPTMAGAAITLTKKFTIEAPIDMIAWQNPHAHVSAKI